MKNQVGEHIPTVIPLMAQALGTDVKSLFKMMEQGELDPMTALPKLAKLMSEMSAPAMAKYMRSLPYFQGITQENRQIWGQRFLESGGTEGLTRFWEVMNQIMLDGMSWADALGDVSGDIMWYASNLMLLPGELKRWSTEGEKDVRNFWQRHLGNFELFSARWDVLWEGNTKKLEALSEAFGNVLEPLQSIYSKILPGQVESYYVSQARQQAREQLAKEGKLSGPDAKRLLSERTEEIYQAGRVIRGERVASGTTTQQLASEAINERLVKQGTGNRFSDWVYSAILPGAMSALSELFGVDLGPTLINQQGIGEFSEGSIGLPSESIMFPERSPRIPFRENIPATFSLPTPPKNYLEGILSDYEREVSDVTQLERLLSPLISGAREGQWFGDLPSNIPQNSPVVVDMGNRRIDINISGNITVDGEIETMTSDEALGQQVFRILEEEVGSSLVNTGMIPN